MTSPANQRIPQRLRGWLGHPIIRVILFPVLLTRLVFASTAYLAQFIQPNPDYANPVKSLAGWEFHDFLFLDMWARWDSRWYLDIIKNGYVLQGSLTEVQSNLAFYPLYPFLVRVFAAPLTLFTSLQTASLIAGILLSTAFLIGALYLLYKLVRLEFPDEAQAERTIILLLLFPAGFVFSCLYTEAAFLFFAVGAFYAARRGQWALAGLAAAALSLTRPLGPLVVLPLGLIYLQQIGWNWRAVRPNILWLAGAPLALAAHMLVLLPISGDFLAVFKIQQAWHKAIVPPWETFFTPYGLNGAVTAVDQIALLLFLSLAALAIFRYRMVAGGLFPLLFLAPVLFSGTLASATRYCAVLFPGFIVLGRLTRRPWLYKTLALSFFATQVMFVALWTRFYFVV